MPDGGGSALDWLAKASFQEAKGSFQPAEPGAQRLRWELP